MCLNPVILRHLNTPTVVPCGSCSVCQQTKADQRSIVLYNSSYSSSFFFHLTFSNKYIFCVKKSDFNEKNLSEKGTYLVPVYQGVNTKIPIDYIDIERPTETTPDLKKAPGYLGILYYPAIQKFFKRLRKHLALNGINARFKYFCAGEYGPTTFRPHYHIVVLFDKKVSLRDFKIVLRKSWTFCSKKRLLDYCQISINPSKYINQYISLPTSYPRFLKQMPIKPKIKRSTNMGFSNPNFKFTHVIKSLLNNKFTYFAPELNKHFPFPRHVLSKYLCFLTKYNNLTSDSLLTLFKGSARLTYVHHYTDKDTPIYASNLFTVNNVPLLFSKNLFSAFLNNFTRFKRELNPTLPTLEIIFKKLQYNIFRNKFYSWLKEPDHDFIDSSYHYHQSARSLSRSLFKESQFTHYVKTSKLSMR